jgi:hypothetical protein
MYWFFWLLIGGLLLAVIANVLNFLGGERNGKRRTGMVCGIVAAFVIAGAGYFANADIREAARQASEAARAAKAMSMAPFGHL